VTVAPTFEQVESLPLYRLSSDGEAAAAGFWAGYRPSPQAAFGPSATLAQAWQDRGAYLFLGAEPSDAEAFVQQLGTVLAPRSPAGLVRFAWIADPDRLEDGEGIAVLEAQASGSGSGIAWTVAEPAQFAVGEYAVTVEAGQPLSEADPSALGWGIAIGDLAFAGPQGRAASIAGSAWIPLAGPALGCWRAGLGLPASGGDGLAQLGTMIRYAAPRSDGTPGDAVEMLGMPVLAQGAADLTLHLSFDWLNPLAAERTRLGFFADDGSGPAVAPLAATLRTSCGYATTLTPRVHGAPLRPARFVLCRTPALVEAKSRAGAASYHLAPDGGFDLAAVPPGEPGGDAAQRLMFGLSGSECAALPSEGSAIVHFDAGKPAFAPGAAPQASRREREDTEPLSDYAATAHLAVLPPRSGEAGLAYFAQPLQAPLFAPAADLGPGFLDQLELPSGQLPSWVAGSGPPPSSLPAAPLAGVPPGAAALARRIEAAALAPARRAAVGAAPAGLAAAVGSGTTTATPQGLLVEAGEGGIQRVAIASLPAAPATPAELSQLSLTAVGPNLATAIQSNELFFVVGEPDAYLADSSVPYRLDETGLAVAASRGVEAETIETLRPIVLPGGVPKEFETEAAFDEAVQEVAGEWLGTLREVAGFLRAVLSDWTFQLSPRSWRRGAAPTMMLFKFCDRALTELVEDRAAWGWPGMPEAEASQAELRRIVAEARKHTEEETPAGADPYAAFYRTVLADPEWNGVLFFNVPVSLAELPSELQFLAAGVKAGNFYAHHIGFSATPVEVEESGAIAAGQTAAFGLVDYRDPYDLVLSPEDPNPDFDFKALRLTARFENAALASFDAEVELMVNRLLAAPLTKLDPTHGNNMLLSGSSQRQGGKLSYAFALEGKHRYATDRTVLDTVEVDTLQMLTTAPAAGAGQAVATFALGGFLRFVDDPGFDAFGYGPAVAVPDPAAGDGRLRFDGLAIEMRFPLGGSGAKEFAATLSGVRLDADRSQPRPRSLVGNFPVALGTLVSSAGQAPADVGFASISAPLDQSALTPPWYGLTYTLDLGTLGALTGSAPITLTLLAAWGAGEDVGSRPVYIGLRLPNGPQWALQSVIKLGFRSFQFATSERNDGGLSYVLRLRRFALSLLAISLPPGNLDIVLFGDPDHPESRSVAWYAAYAEEQPEKKPARLGQGV